MSLISFGTSVAVLVGFLGMTTSAQPHRNGTWMFGPTCDAAQKETIQSAFDDALGLIKGAHTPLNSTVDLQNDPAAIDFFGVPALQALGQPGVNGIFDTFINSEWRFQVYCSQKNTTDFEDTCETPGIYDGLLSTSVVSSNTTFNFTRRADPDSTPNTRNVKLLVCDRFYQAPPLIAAIKSGLNANYIGRADVLRYTKNQGVALLRQLLPHLPPQAPLDTPLFDAWIDVNGKKAEDTAPAPYTISGHSVAGAKLLARFKDGNLWSAKNSNSYALFALVKYLEKSFLDTYPFFPRIDRGGAVEESSAPVVFSSQNGSTIDTVNITAFSNIALNHIGDETKVFPSNKTSPYIARRTIRTREALFMSVDDYPAEYNTALQTFKDNSIALTLGSSNAYLSKVKQCGSTNQTQYNNATLVSFTRADAVELIKQYCEDKAITKYEIVPVINSGSKKTHAGLNKQTAYFKTKVVPSDSTVLLSLGMDISPSALSGFNFNDAFEGLNTTTKVENCRLTYENLIDSCDQENGNVETKFGGVLTINDKIYTAVATSKGHDADSPELVKKAAVENKGELRCTDWNSSMLWFTEAQQISRNTCICSYANFPAVKDVFCRQNVCRGLVSFSVGIVIVHSSTYLITGNRLCTNACFGGDEKSQVISQHTMNVL
ncbi:hypothetical protein BDV96DRAFT_601762 [Lophiotrema nucula]|uniref:Uncharacterized protein n=1 Tax=Lophiotrema nucula TaxID=690887 RepID=A0A6A5Z0L9_9PLEO|nr:hypothetical protein BDV96DRAFT_601762 [Lophiotrema nucula]